MSEPFRKVIVVGASSGIGEAVAKELVKGGAKVALVARREGELIRVKSELAELGTNAFVYPHDVENVDEVGPLFDNIVSELGGLDTVVYASGAMPKINEGEYHFEKDKLMVHVNLLGAMAWLNPAAAYFEAARAGNIIGISSIAGERGRRGNPAYCASKAGFSTYLESLRNRCSRYGVNVVTIKPGFVDTAMTKGMPGLFWLISAEEAAKKLLALARKKTSASGFVPERWSFVAFVVRAIPSFIFRKLNF